MIAATFAHDLGLVIGGFTGALATVLLWAWYSRDEPPRVDVWAAQPSTLYFWTAIGDEADRVHEHPIGSGGGYVAWGDNVDQDGYALAAPEMHIHRVDVPFDWSVQCPELRGEAP